MKLIAIYTDYQGNKNQMETSENYTTKTAYKISLGGNGFKNIRILTEDDINCSEGFKTAKGEKQWREQNNF